MLFDNQQSEIPSQTPFYADIQSTQEEQQFKFELKIFMQRAQFFLNALKVLEEHLNACDISKVKDREYFTRYWGLAVDRSKIWVEYTKLLHSAGLEKQDIITLRNISIYKDPEEFKDDFMQILGKAITKLPPDAEKEANILKAAAEAVEDFEMIKVNFPMQDPSNTRIIFGMIGAFIGGVLAAIIVMYAGAAIGVAVGASVESIRVGSLIGSCLASIFTMPACFESILGLGVVSTYADAKYTMARTIQRTEELLNTYFHEKYNNMDLTEINEHLTVEQNNMDLSPYSYHFN